MIRTETIAVPAVLGAEAQLRNVRGFAWRTTAPGNTILSSALVTAIVEYSDGQRYTIIARPGVWYGTGKGEMTRVWLTVPGAGTGVFDVGTEEGDTVSAAESGAVRIVDVDGNTIGSHTLPDATFALLAEGGRRSQVYRAITAAAAAFQSPVLAPHPDRGILVLVETDAVAGGRNFVVQWYSDDGATLISEAGNTLNVLVNTRQRINIAERSQILTGATNLGSAAGLYDGRNAGNAGGDLLSYGPMVKRMGLRAAAGSEARITIWL
jgi:hypothetical protein